MLKTDGKEVAGMTTFSGNVPSAEKILSILARLYADQHGVTVKVAIVDGDEGEVNADGRKTCVH